MRTKLHACKNGLKTEGSILSFSQRQIWHRKWSVGVWPPVIYLIRGHSTLSALNKWLLRKCPRCQPCGTPGKDVKEALKKQRLNWTGKELRRLIYNSGRFNETCEGVDFNRKKRGNTLKWTKREKCKITTKRKVSRLKKGKQVMQIPLNV